MTKTISKALMALLVFGSIAVISCNDSATTEEVKTDTSIAPPVPDTSMAPMIDTTPVASPIDTSRDTKVPRN